jgi:hypothetical protein
MHLMQEVCGIGHAPPPFVVVQLLGLHVGALTPQTPSVQVAA